MSVFKDSRNREWILRLHTRPIEDIRKELGVDPISLTDPVFPKLFTDPALLVNCLWIVCRKQAAEAKLSQDDFSESMFGEFLDPARKALEDAILFFSPISIQGSLTEVRTQLDGMIQTFQEIAANPEISATSLENMKREADRLIESLTQSTSATGSQVSSAANQTTEP